MQQLCYSSIPKRKISQLSQDSFAAFKPFINIFDCGGSHEGKPYHLITKQDWDFHARYKAGERDLIYPSEMKFNPYFCIVRNIFSPQHVDEHIQSNRTTYYTSGRNGLALLYLDIDAHQPWQTDEYKAKAVLERLFPTAFFRASKRGQNGYLKVRYMTMQDFNATAAHLQRVLKRLFLHLGILCDIEVKGTITCDGKSGSLAKLPFASPYPCDMRDDTDCWNYPQLRKFQACGMVNAARIRVLAEQMDARLDDAKIQQFAAYKKSLGEAAKAATVVHDEPTVATPVFTQAAPPPAAPGQERALRPIRAQQFHPRISDGDLDGDAFARNHEDIKPFVRDFWKRFRRFPTADETLDWLQQHGRYSGDWHDNAAKRATRVGQILRFTEQTFDPSKLSTGQHQAVQLNADCYAWWVRQHFGAGMAIQRTNHARFDPVTMTAPVSDLWISAQFIQTFLAVAEFCLRDDPLANKAVPTSRIKKLWGMVADGAKWNQRHYQIVRDRLEKMGVIRITDRQHTAGKAWRWDSGDDFPAGSWKEEQRRFRERHPLSSGDGIDLIGEKKEHNTLYHYAPRFDPVDATIPLIRPPP
jgi:hypothetical protein